MRGGRACFLYGLRVNWPYAGKGAYPYEEKEEQAKLRNEYLALFREGFKQRLDSIKVVKPNN